MVDFVGGDDVFADIEVGSDSLVSSYSEIVPFLHLLEDGMAFVSFEELTLVLSLKLSDLRMSLKVV